MVSGSKDCFLFALNSPFSGTTPVFTGSKWLFSSSTRFFVRPLTFVFTGWFGVET